MSLTCSMAVTQMSRPDGKQGNSFSKKMGRPKLIWCGHYAFDHILCLVMDDELYDLTKSPNV